MQAFSLYHAPNRRVTAAGLLLRFNLIDYLGIR